MSEPSPAARLPAAVIFPMAAACAMGVATIYYNQPLLPLMASSFGHPASDLGKVATATQFGYALGLFLFVPLGDRVDRRRLILLLLFCNLISLSLYSISPDLQVATLASVALGLTAVTAQIIIPAVSGLVAPAQRGRAVAILLSGLSTGVLLSRTLSGFIGAHLGWRAVFQFATLADAVLMVLVWRTLPKTDPTTDTHYLQLLGSLWRLLAKQPILRAACVNGFLLFAAFGAFWSTMAALLARPPYGFGAAAAGGFGLLSIAGIGAASTIGRLTDRFGTRPMLFSAGLMLVLAFGLLSAAAHHLWAVIIAVIFLDVGNRTGLIANQSRIFGLDDRARSRINTVFMCFYFLGGAVGAQTGQAMASGLGWSGLAVTGLGFASLALCAHVIWPGKALSAPRAAHDLSGAA